MNTRVTMKDIANELDISIDAVSKALKNSSEISDLTKEKVRAKAEELGYIKNSAAVSLKTGSSNVVVIYINSLMNPYFSIIVEKLVKKLDKLGFTPLLTLIDSYTTRKIDLTNIYINKCQKAIIFPPPNDDTIEALKSNSVDFIVVGSKPRDKTINYIITDDENGGYQVGQQFALSASKKALYCSASPDETSTRRSEGFVKGIKAFSSKEYKILPFEGDTNVLIKQTINEIKVNHFDFIFAHNDYLASLIKDALINENLNNQITLYGFDSLGLYINTYRSMKSIGGDFDKIVDLLADFVSSKMKIQIEMPVKLYNL